VRDDVIKERDPETLQSAATTTNTLRSADEETVIQETADELKRHVTVNASSQFPQYWAETLARKILLVRTVKQPSIIRSGTAHFIRTPKGTKIT
jgi:hypothetical protein